MRVLLATDGSNCAKSAADALRVFPLPPASELLIFSAAVPPPPGVGAACSEDLRRCFTTLAEAAVANARAGVADRFATVETRVTGGEPRERILGAAEEWRPDLIVLGARGLGGAGRLLLGSVSVGVARHARCPVLVVKRRPTRIYRIVIAVDGSECALNAAQFIARLPLHSNATVRLFGVAQPPHYPSAAPDILENSLWSALAAATEELRSQMHVAVERAASVFPEPFAKVEREIAVGQVVHEIVRASREHTDLLVLGARGVGAFSRLLLGSVSDTVLRHAPCSVLIVKHD